MLDALRGCDPGFSTQSAQGIRIRYMGDIVGGEGFIEVINEDGVPQ